MLTLHHRAVVELGGAGVGDAAVACPCALEVDKEGGSVDAEAVVVVAVAVVVGAVCPVIDDVAAAAATAEFLATCCRICVVSSPSSTCSALCSCARLRSCVNMEPYDCRSITTWRSSASLMA